jgi:hypothetical protein
MDHRRSPVSLTLPDGRSVRGVRLEVHSTLPLPPDRVWPELTRPRSLMRVCRPLLTFRHPEGPLPERWTEGRPYRFRLCAFGVLPLGGHRIVLERIDEGAGLIRSRERGAMVSVWNHDITLRPSAEGRTAYRDTVDLHAGALTGIVALWATAFYRHRQKRWAAWCRRQPPV